MKYKVVVCGVSNYNGLKTAVLRKHFDYSGYIGKVLLKPNLTTAAGPESAIITHPGFVKAVRNLFSSKNVMVADSPGYFVGNEKKRFFAITGYDKIKDVKLNLIDELDMKKDSILAKGKYKLVLPELKWTFLVNIPKLKLHPLTGFTAGVKNLMGLIPGYQKKMLHNVFNTREKFSRMLLGLYTKFNPQLTVVDAVECLQGTPVSGTKKNCGLIIAGNDALAVDTVIGHISNIHSPVLEYARKSGYEAATIENIELIYENISKNVSIKLSSKEKNSWLAKLMQGDKRIFNHVYPKIDKKKCIDCGKCAKECINQAMHSKVNKNKCFKCFHCISVCPKGAIRRNLDFNPLFRLYKRIK